MTEALFTLLTAGIEGAGALILPGDISIKVAGTCAHLIDTATYEAWEAGEDVGSEASIVGV